MEQKHSQFTYDGLGRNVSIVEPISGTPTTTQFVWCGNQRCELRDGSGNLTTSGKQYFPGGQVNYSSGTPTSYFYCKDEPPGSVREMTNSSGSIVSELSYYPYGRSTVLQGSTLPDFQYARYYVHSRSGLNLTLNRAYNSSLGRWISRDPIAEQSFSTSQPNWSAEIAPTPGMTKPPSSELLLGLSRTAIKQPQIPEYWSSNQMADNNLYEYANNQPVRFTDPLGLRPCNDQPPNDDPADFCHYLCRNAAWEINSKCLADGGNPIFCFTAAAAFYVICKISCDAGNGVPGKGPSKCPCK